MSKHSRYNAARIILIFWTLFIGLGAVGGALAMLIDPTGETTGMAGLLPGLRKLPFADVLFQNLVFSGISLLIVNGITNLIAAIYAAVGTNEKVLVVYFSRMSKPKRQAAKSLKLKPRKKPTERSDSGGAVGSICTGGICR